MADVLVLVAHPDIARSRINRALAAQARLLPSDAVEVRDLYALYPDYVIDIEAEQAALDRARFVVWVHPVQWYSMPSLMKLWVDDVLAFRWAYGPGGRARKAEAHEVPAHAPAHAFAERLLALAGEARASEPTAQPDVAADERRITTDD